jgi:hypothetical protein
MWRFIQQMAVWFFALMFLAEFWRWWTAGNVHAGIDAFICAYIGAWTYREYRRAL